MADDLARLVHEVERVITAPYVPSLQDLYEILVHVSQREIQRWAAQKPCQVGLLADVLVESLSLSRVALPVLSTFAVITRFRDALLNRHPVVLNTFLEKAIGSEESDEYTTACINLLSSPLPSGTVPPGRLADFVQKLVSSIASQPCAETVAPLHSVMNMLSGSAGLLKEIPEEIMSNLQHELTKTLRNMEDHMGILMSLATFARIASIQPDYLKISKRQTEPQTWLLNIQHFFGSKRGQKTLDLVVLRVILACSSNSGSLTTSQAAKSISLAISIVDAIDLSQKNAWVASGSSKIAKLCDKVVRDGLDRDTQLMGLTFLLSISPVSNLPSQVRNLGLRLLVSRDSRAALITMEHRLVIRLTQSLAACDESIVYELLRFTVDAVKDNNLSQDALSSLHVADLLLSSFQQNESQHVISSLLSSASTKETIASLFGRFPSKSTQMQCEGSEICYCTYTALQNQILRNLFEMYFTAALSQNGDNRDVDIIKSFVGRVSLTLSTCSFANSSPKDFRKTLLLRDRREFVSPEPPNRRDWRSQVTNTFLQNSQAAHDSMLRQVEEVCFDLERRCYDVEGPLRCAEDDRNKKILEVEQLRQQNESLEVSCRQSAQSISDLRQEMTRLEEQAEGTYHRAEELSSLLKSARDELREQQNLSLENLRNEKDKSRSRELDLIATSTEKDDRIEEIQEELRHMQSENERIQQTLDTEIKEKTSSSDTIAFLQADIQENKKMAEKYKVLYSQKEEEARNMSETTRVLEMETEKMKAMMENQNLEMERLSGLLQEAKDTSKSQIEDMRREHDVQISHGLAETTKLKEENGRLQQEMHDMAKEVSKKIQTKDKRMQQLESKVQSMRDEREAKAREFSEAQQHIGRLMGVMGFSAQSADPKPQQLKSAKKLKSTARHSHVYDDEDDDSQLVESFESMNSNLENGEPTPKRPRGNRLSYPSQPPVQAKCLPASQSSPLIAEPARHSTRQPLAETDLNSPKKSPPLKSSKSNQPTTGPTDNFEDLELDMDLEFSRDFLFTSTPFSGPNDR